MSEHAVPLELDWVTTRRKCSVWPIFKALELGVQGDIDAMNAGMDPNVRLSFHLVKLGNRFSVVLEADGLSSKSVDFSVIDKEIVIAGDGAPKITATITLNKFGRCMLKVNGEEMEQWQVRRIALEGIFFGAGK